MTAPSPEPAPEEPSVITGLALELRDIQKEYRGHHAVRGISLEVPRGRVVGLLGPNGAGKSTTMKICSGVAQPTSGTVRVAGIDPVTDPVGARRRAGYVPDVGGLFPRLTGWEHLELAARLHNLDRSWVARGRALIERLGLEDAAGRRASTYSHGMGRKLSFAIALLAHPQLLLLDEPFDGVDPAGAVAVRELIAETVSDGAGVLVSTHLLDAAELIADWLVVVRAGTVLARGTASELREKAGRAGPLEDAYLALMEEAGAPLNSAG